jgi:phosphopantetheinyl transferase (holo-ACP synthase)
VGVDLVEISRVRSMIASRATALLGFHGTGAPLRRHGESGGTLPLRSRQEGPSRRSAVVTKLADHWREMEVELDDIGRQAGLHGRASARRELGVSRTWISLTHGDDLATAFVVLESAP